MNGAIPVSWPVGAVCPSTIGRLLMKIILHIGVHRTGTTSFQQFLRDNQGSPAAQSLEFWGPKRVRRSLLPGVFRQPTDPKAARRAAGRARLHLARLQDAGVKQLLVSDENMIGSARQCLRSSKLYPAVGDRMARICAVFGGQVTRVVMMIRAQDLWWASAAAFTVARGHPVPSAKQCEEIAADARTWRDVIIDLACAAPDAERVIVPFEHCAGNPQALLKTATGLDIGRDRQVPWLNRSLNAQELRELRAEQGADLSQIPDTAARWQPFSAEQAAQLRENYADDLHWLQAGANGLARLTEIQPPKRAGTSQPAGPMTRGRDYDGGQGHKLQQ